MQLLRSYGWILILMLAVVVTAIIFIPSGFRKYIPPKESIEGFEWNFPDINRVPPTAESMLIRYGRDLIANTSAYLGPRGKIASVSNGMNCQNCHLEAGTKFLGNNYSAVYSTYPRYRARSGSIESIYKRINDCMERSLNGKNLDSNSREMKAMEAYIIWLGKNVPKKVKPAGVGIADIPFLDRAADTVRGNLVYINKCKKCHGSEGAGLLNPDSNSYAYPPLWGDHSYNTGAGLFRISRLAGYVKYNMPFGTAYNAEKLTDEEAWDVAAFVNSRPRPQKRFIKDWPDISTKPFDHPFGPYKDSFTETQHKYGPFKEMQKR